MSRNPRRANRSLRAPAAVLARAAATVLAAAVIAGTVAAAPFQQQDRRLRQLEVFEDLLTETVHEYVNDYLNAAVDGEGDDAEPVVVKVGMQAGAHGMYIDGYGVIFSIQTPQVSVIPRSLEVRFAEPFAVYRLAPEDGRQRRVSGNVIEFRSNMIRQQLKELEALLERELDEGVEAEVTDARLAQIEEMRRTLADLTRVELRTGPEDITVVIEDQPEAVAETGDGVHEDRPTHSIEDYYRSVVREQRSMKERLARSAAQLEISVNEAAVETLSSYGGVIKGLDDDDRISVLVFPPNRWAFRTRQGPAQRPEEYVISVRYKDIRDFDNQKIDLAEFRDRVKIHSRLGTEIELEIKQER